MEIDGGRDQEIKRNMPLGVTEGGARVRGMTGLQAWEPHMGKNNSATSFCVSLSLSLFFSPCKPLLVGEEINSRLVYLRLEEFVVVCCWACVCMCFCLLLFLFCSRKPDEYFWGLSHTQGRCKIPSLPPSLYFTSLLPFYCSFFLPVWHLFSITSLSSSSLPSAL